jgi:hypothetical protein
LEALHEVKDEKDEVPSYFWWIICDIPPLSPAGSTFQSGAGDTKPAGKQPPIGSEPCWTKN